MQLLGRESEQRAIDAALDAAREGLSGVLHLRGEPGIGKTSLVEYAVGSAPALQVLRTSGLESERSLGFAGLHQLLLPLVDRVDRLPSAQRDALGCAFGSLRDRDVSRFLIGLGTLTLLADAAVEEPVLCAVDDAQWLDEESLAVLAFVARRLQADRIAMIFSARDGDEGGTALDGLPQLRLSGLSDDAARRLVVESASRPFDSHTIARIVAEARGNPLALVELGDELADGTFPVGLAPPDPQPVGSRVEAHFLRRILALPEDSQTFLRVLAAEPSDEVLVWQAASDLGIPPDAIDAGIEARLIVRRPELAFRHPLIRSAAYRAALDRDRRQVHQALAGRMDPATDSDRRAWHLAAAAAGPDASVADELERCAERVRDRGGWSSRAALLARAAELTLDRRLRAERFLAASRAALVAGVPSRAHLLLDRARASFSEPVFEAVATRVEAGIRTFTSSAEVPAMLLDAAETLARNDLRLARDTLAEALEACLLSWQLTRNTTPKQVAQAALLMAPVDGPPELADLMIEAFATRFADAAAAAIPLYRKAIDFLCANDVPTGGTARWAVLGTFAAADSLDFDRYRTIISRLESAERRSGALEPLRSTLSCKGPYLLWSGDFAGADAALSEAADISRSLDETAKWGMLKIELMAWQGRDADVRAVAPLLTGEFAERVGNGVATNMGRMAMAILEVSQGHYAEALVHARHLMDDDPPAHGSRVLPEVVEAGARSGEREVAVRALTVLEDRTRASGTPWARGLLARSRALLDERDPEPLYREAVAHLEQTHVATELARAHLLFGEWLRRQTRRVDAREQLRTAYDMFADMGAAAFAERARLELAATGERARKRRADTAKDLTPQEHQVAVLAADGSTNAEIAAILFISAATVDYHLGKVYRKLGITSRRQLGSVPVIGSVSR